MMRKMKIKDAKIYPLSDIAAAAQARIQADFPELNPIIGVSHNLRDSGFAADTMTIQNHASDQRILIILHDEQPDIIDFEFGKISEDPSFEFEQIAYNDLDESRFYEWMSQLK